MREVVSQLWIGNAMEARDIPMVLDAGIEAVVDLAIEERPISPARELILCRIPILDGSGNARARLELAVDTVSKLVSSKVPTLVACSAGMSRSPAVVAAALSRVSTISLAESLDRIAALGPCDVSPGLWSDIVSLLDESSA